MATDASLPLPHGPIDIGGDWVGAFILYRPTYVRNIRYWKSS